MHAPSFMERSEGFFRESVLSASLYRSRDRIQVIGLGDKCLWSVSHLTILCAFIYFNLTSDKRTFLVFLSKTADLSFPALSTWDRCDSISCPLFRLMQWVSQNSQHWEECLPLRLHSRLKHFNGNMEILLPWNTSLGFNCYNYPSAGGGGYRFPSCTSCKACWYQEERQAEDSQGYLE